MNFGRHLPRIPFVPIQPFHPEKTEPPKAVVVQVIPSVIPNTIVLKLLNIQRQNEVEFIPKVRIWNPMDQKTVEIDFEHRWDTIAKIPRSLFKGLTTLQIPKSIWGNEVLVQIPEPKGTQGVEIQLFADMGMGGVTHYIEPKTETIQKKGAYLEMPDRYHTVQSGTIYLEKY